MGIKIVITADHKRVKVMYREAGKQYRAPDEQGPGNPFEEVYIEPGQTWTLPAGGEFLKVVEMGGTTSNQSKSGDD